LSGDGAVSFRQVYTAALLLTENCQLDKRDMVDGTAVHRISRLSFAPLHSINDVNENVQSLLRDTFSIDPPEGVYLDDVDGQECFAMLGEAFWLPAPFFSPRLEDFSKEPDVGSDPLRLVATRNDVRVCGMCVSERILLNDKMHVFWTATKRRGSELVRQDPLD
jgi:hypothetical protein